MAEIDRNGPTVQINVETDQAVKDIKNLDTVTGQAVDGMNKKFNSFSENVRKTLDDLKNGGWNGSNTSSSSSTSFSNSSGKSEQVAKERQKEQALKRQEAYELQAMRQRKEQIENGKQLLASTKNMALAITGALTGGIGAKAVLDFTHHLGQLQNFLKATNSNAGNAIAYRNEFRNRHVDDGQYWGVYRNVASTIQQAQGNGRILNVDQRWGYEKLHQIDPSIQMGKQAKGANKTDEEFKRLVDAYNKYLATTKDDETMKNLVGKLIFGDENFVGAVKRGKLNISRADMAKAIKEANSMDANAKVDAARQKSKTSFETALAGAVEKASPIAVKFLDGLSGLLDRNGDLVIGTAALLTLTTSLASFFTVIRLGGRVLSALGFAGAASAAGTAGAAGGGIIAGAKSAIGKAAKGAIGFAGRNAGRTIRFGALPVAVGIGMLDPTETAATTPEAIAREQRKKNIENQLNVKVKQSWVNDKFYVQTKDGAYIYIDSQFYEPIEQLKRRLETGQIERTSPFVKPTTGGIMGAIIPQAHAGDLSRDIQLDAGKGKNRNEKLSTNEQRKNAKAIFDILTRKDQYGSLPVNGAIGVTSNFQGESSLNPRAIGDNGISFGLGQWNKERLDNFQKLFHHPLNKSTLEEQVMFAKWEMLNTHKRAGDLIKKARSPQEAVAYAVKYYEVPSDIPKETVRRIGFIPSVQNAVAQNNNQTPPTPQQMQSNLQAQKVHNEYKNSTANTTNNGGNTNQHNTINIHVASGTVENIKKGVQQGLQFPQANAFNGTYGGA